jgi:hypothetical protein
MKANQALEFFAASDAKPVASTANEKDGTIDVVWYTGAQVPRKDPDTGDPYMLTLDMDGARLDRLNAGAPVFDTHFTGDDYKSVVAGKAGTKAQVGVVNKAWADGANGMATLKFDLGDEDGAELFRKVSSGIVQNLSFGAWIYNREKTTVQAQTEGKPPYGNPNEIGMFTATDWEPFEISVVPVPADFNTTFLSAEPLSTKTDGQAARASSPHKEKPAMAESTTQTAGAEARVNEQALVAARGEAVKLERERIVEIEHRATRFKSILGDDFVRKAISDGKTADQFSVEAFAALSAKGQQTTGGEDRPIRSELSITRDGGETRLAAMQNAMLLRHDPKFFLAKHPKTGELLNGCGAENQRRAEEMGREYVGLSLMEMARESLEIRGINHRGMNKNRIAELALQAPSRGAEYFGGGAESTSDFPAILANVANKTLRQAYESYPRTFQPFCRQVTAPDFKPINRVQLSDAPALQQLNEKGEYHRANLTDMNTNYSLQTFGEVVAITRKVIINDDLQAMTRIPAILGVAAAQLESNTVWGLITSNPVMTLDGKAIFHTAHSNLLSGVASSIDPTVGSSAPLTALAKARVQMRLQKAPQGTPLDLVPRFMAVPPSLETYALQLIYPINIASSDQTKVVPEWVRSLVPVVEPRLDNSTGTATNWFLFTDPALIDTLEYCYLEGQQGVYIETRQGFEVDGVEIKARMDFGAAAIDYRGLQKSAGA